MDSNNSCTTHGKKALPWSVEEDDFLQSERHKHKNWMSLAWDLNALFGRARSALSCRRRAVVVQKRCTEIGCQTNISVCPSFDEMGAERFLSPQCGPIEIVASSMPLATSVSVDTGVGGIHSTLLSKPSGLLIEHDHNYGTDTGILQDAIQCTTVVTSQQNEATPSSSCAFTSKPLSKKKTNSSFMSTDHSYSMCNLTKRRKSKNQKLKRLCTSLIHGAAKVDRFTTQSQILAASLCNSADLSGKLILNNNSYTALENFNVSDIAKEFLLVLPGLYHIVQKLLVKGGDLSKKEAVANAIPKLAAIYSIIMQSRNHMNSLFQRVVSVTLFHSLAEQKVYDRLNTFGFCLSFTRTMHVIRIISGNFGVAVKAAVKSGKRCRFVGDNLNFSVAPSYERKDSHGHMKHMFISALLVSQPYFVDKPMVPQIPLINLKIDDVLVLSSDYLNIQADAIQIAGEVISRRLAHLSFVGDFIPKFIGSNKVEDDERSPTVVIPMGVLDANEMSFNDDVKILDNYEEIIETFFLDRTQEDSSFKMQIGGDQLTRERLNYALSLRRHNPGSAGFAHIGAVTVEFFHMLMNIQDKLIFKHLYNPESAKEPATMVGQIERRHRRSVKPKAMDAFHANKDFLESYFSTYIVEAALQFFGMESVNSIPTLNACNQHEDKAKWVTTTLAKFVDTYVFPWWTGQSKETVEIDRELVQPLIIVAADGTSHTLHSPPVVQVTHSCTTDDMVKNYGHITLEVCMAYQILTKLIERPDRNHLLSVCKMLMTMFRSTSNKSKYAGEILNLLLQQYSLLPLREACQCLEACFVKRPTSPLLIPADLQMEYIVKATKKHVQHMHSKGDSEKVMAVTKALYNVSLITKNAHKTAGVRERYTGHSKPSSKDDEQDMLDDLREVRPFLYVSGRKLEGFKDVPLTVANDDGLHGMREWFLNRKEAVTVISDSQQ